MVAPLGQDIDFQFVQVVQRPAHTVAIDPGLYDFQGKKRSYERGLHTRLNALA